jgi:hypothetical protein
MRHRGHQAPAGWTKEVALQRVEERDAFSGESNAENQLLCLKRSFSINNSSTQDFTKYRATKVLVQMYH